MVGNMQVFQNSSFSWKAQILFIYLFFNKKFFFQGPRRLYYLFIYLFLAASGLSCSTRDFHCGMQDLSLRCEDFSLVAVRGLLSSCGVQVFSSLVVAGGLQDAWAL